MFKARAETTDGDDAGLQRIDLTRYEGLQGVYNLRRDHNRVFAHMRRGAMGANAFDRNVDTVYIGEGIAGGVANFAGGRPARCMGCEDIIRAREFFEKTVFQHRFCAEPDFFGRLADKD